MHRSENNGQPTFTIVTIDESEDYESKINRTIGALRHLNACIRNGKPTGEAARSVSAHQKEVQKILGSLIKNST